MPPAVAALPQGGLHCASRRYIGDIEYENEYEFEYDGVPPNFQFLVSNFSHQ
jgi:hypothetical protein